MEQLSRIYHMHVNDGLHFPFSNNMAPLKSIIIKVNIIIRRRSRSWNLHLIRNCLLDLKALIYEFHVILLAGVSEMAAGFDRVYIHI